jgi:hypothetical protein
MLSLNLLVALKEEGEVPRDAALRELTQEATAVINRASSVPGVTFLMGPAYGYIRRIPGLDVALGVTAYQLAASTKSALQTANRGRNIAQAVARNVGQVVADATSRLEDVAHMGADLGRYPVRAAVAGAGGASRRVQEAAEGMLLAVARTPASTWDAIAGAGYGAVEGAIEGGTDPGEAAAAAIEGARQAAEEMSLSPDDAAVTAAAGALEAAEAVGGDTLVAVERALPEALAQDARRLIEEEREGEDVMQGTA